MDKWLRSDLIGIPATLLVLGVFLLAVVAFIVAGSVAGIVIAVALGGLLFYLISKTDPDDLAGVHRDLDEDRHRVLVVANEGLDHVDLGAELGARGEAAATEVLVIAPVVATLASHAVSDDVDRERERAQRRVDRTLRRLKKAGLPARGHVDDEGDPMQALLDGMREFPPNEVVLIPGHDADWEGAESLADRVRSEVGAPVTELGGFGSA